RPGRWRFGAQAQRAAAGRCPPRRRPGSSGRRSPERGVGELVELGQAAVARIPEVGEGRIEWPAVAAPLPAEAAADQEPAVQARDDLLDDGPGAVRGADLPPVVTGRPRPVRSSGPRGPPLPALPDERRDKNG